MRPRIRAMLLLLLLGATVLEALTWIRGPLYKQVHAAYPEVAIVPDGHAVFYDTRVDQLPDGTQRYRRELDTTRNPGEMLALGDAQALVGAVTPGADFRAPDRDFVLLAAPFSDARFLLMYFRSREPVLFVPVPPLERMANMLGSIEATRRGIDPRDAYAYRVPGTSGTVFTLAPGAAPRVPVDWRVENGRLVCRDVPSWGIIAAIGPDGYTRGPTAGEGERFGTISATAVVRSRPAGTYESVLLDWDARKLYAITMPTAQAEAQSIAADSAEPLALAVETRPLHPAESEVGADSWPYCAIVGNRVIAFLANGAVLAEIVLEAGERVTATVGALLVQAGVAPDYFGPPRRGMYQGFAVETRMSPAHRGDERRRLRLFAPGRPEVARDVTLTPMRASEVLLANITAAFALLRPLPLTLSSAVSGLPDPGETWWWRDPWLAGGRYALWLVLSFALAGLLAWRARRSARLRCATPREVLSWTAAVFLLGPVGLLWMKLVLPRVPVEAVGQARRAVNLDASPSTTAPWPDPKPLGIEVFS